MVWEEFSSAAFDEAACLDACSARVPSTKSWHVCLQGDNQRQHPRSRWNRKMERHVPWAYFCFSCLPSPGTPNTHLVGVQTLPPNTADLTQPQGEILHRVLLAKMQFEFGVAEWRGVWGATPLARLIKANTQNVISVRIYVTPIGDTLGMQTRISAEICRAVGGSTPERLPFRSHASEIVSDTASGALVVGGTSWNRSRTLCFATFLVSNARTVGVLRCSEKCFSVFTLGACVRCVRRMQQPLVGQATHGNVAHFVHGVCLLFCFVHLLD
jgi:hypothetical protein